MRSLGIIVASLALALLAASCSASTTLASSDRADREASISEEVASATAPEPADVSESDDAAPRSDDSLPTLFDSGAFSGDLLNDCIAGDDLACDILYQVSPFDSFEESVALDCGGRGPALDLFCTDGVDPDGENLWFSIASPALDGLVDACEGGDMTACDFLYFRSPVGSEYELIGQSCAGRSDEITLDCRTQFPDASP